ncbi:MAG: DNA mismatch repair endonuclease MutL [Candidatus Sumerlaeia bacterium]
MSEAPATSESRIHRLPTRLINQIAAGEVVVRPAAAIKELIENSLDADATRLDIAIEEDALSFTIRDDGCGMGEADLRLSVERHATSKIAEFDDLARLTTRGFRGEALAAIAAVSRIEIVTRRPADLEALRLRASGGREPSVQPCAANPGTTIVVRDLFYNTPARLKFMKSAVSEWGHILQTILRQALTRPDVGFAIRWRGRPYLDLPAGQPLRDRLAQILPSEAGAKLIDVDHTLHDVRVWGAVTNPTVTRRDRRFQYFFANGRPIAHRPLPFALEEAYRGLLMIQRYPLAAILIEMPGDMIDVNVHPTKEEVRFREDSLVAGAVHRAVAEALRAANIVPTLAVTATPQTAPPVAPPPAPPPTASPSLVPLVPCVPSVSTPPPAQTEFSPGFGLPQYGAGQPTPPQPDRKPSAPYIASPPADPAAGEESSIIERLRGLAQPPRAVAQIADCYILAEAGPDGMILIDQHAAHEKWLYLKFMREAASRAIAVQPLLLPHSIELSPTEAAALEPLLAPLREAGFEVEPFGGGTFMVQSVPTVFDGMNIEAFIRDLIDDVGQGNLGRELQRLRERICARAACRAAVKSGDRLGVEEMQRLLDHLLETHELLRCPHGRPTALLLTRDQIDRQFGRLG